MSGYTALERPSLARTVVVYAVVSTETEKAVETFVRHEDAERFLRRCEPTTPI